MFKTWENAVPLHESITKKLFPVVAPNYIIEIVNGGDEYITGNTALDRQMQTALREVYYPLSKISTLIDYGSVVRFKSDAVVIEMYELLKSYFEQVVVYLENPYVSIDVPIDLLFRLNKYHEHLYSIYDTIKKERESLVDPLDFKRQWQIQNNPNRNKHINYEDQLGEYLMRTRGS